MSETTLRVWEELLSDLPDADLLRSVTNLCRSQRDIYPGTNIVAMIRESAHGNAQDASIVALAQVEKAFSTVGAYGSVAFADPLIMVAVSRMGGWPKLCAMELDEWKFARKDFLRLYEASTREAIDFDQVPKALPGIHETSNSANGFDDHPVRLKVVGGTQHKQIGVAS